MKSKIKRANDDWLRFFALVSSAFAMREKCPIVPATPANRAQLIAELKAVVERENILRCIWGWANTIRMVAEEFKFPPDSSLYLMQLDPNARTLDAWAYPRDRLTEAQRDYEQKEKETENDPSIQIVLVSVDDFQALRKAYPNYFVDIDAFLDAVNTEIAA